MNLSLRFHPLACFVTLLLMVFFFAFTSQDVRAATIFVDTTDQGVMVDAACSLEEAILAANSNTGGNGCAAGDDAPIDTIVLQVDVTYPLTAALPNIDSTIVISGNNAII